MSGLRKALQRVEWFLVNGMRVILGVVTGIVICTMFLQLVLRYVFNTAIWGLEELTGHMAVWIYLIGAAYGTYERSHIKAEIVHLFIKKKRLLMSVQTLSACISVVVCLFMISWSYNYIGWSVSRHEITPTLQIPAVLFQIPILISAVVMALYFTIEAFALGSQIIDYRSTEG